MIEGGLSQRVVVLVYLKMLSQFFLINRALLPKSDLGYEEEPINRFVRLESLSGQGYGYYSYL